MWQLRQNPMSNHSLEVIFINILLLQIWQSPLENLRLRTSRLYPLRSISLKPILKSQCEKSRIRYKKSSPSLDSTHLKSLNAKATTWKSQKFPSLRQLNELTFWWMRWYTKPQVFWMCCWNVKKYFPSLGCCSKHKETPTRKNVNFKYYH